MKDGIRQIVGGVDDVEFSFSHAVVREIRLEDGRWTADPFPAAHLRVDERRVGARTPEQIVPNSGLLQECRRPPAVRPAEQTGEEVQAFMLVGLVELWTRIRSQPQR